MHTENTFPIKRNVFILAIAEIASSGYLFAVPVIVDYVAQVTQGHTATYYNIIGVAGFFSLFTSLWMASISDRYNRKYIMAISFFLGAIAWSMFWVFPNLIGVCIGLFLSVLSVGMRKPSICLHETIAMGRNAPQEELRQQQKLQAYAQYFLVIALPVSGVLYEWNPKLPFILNTLAQLIAFIAFFFYAEPHRERSKARSALLHLHTAVQINKNNYKLLFLLMFIALNGAFTVGMIFLFQSYYMSFNNSAVFFSNSLAIIYLIRGVSAQQLSRLEGRFGLRKLLILSAVVCYSGVLIASIGEHNSFLFIGMVMAMAAFGLQKPLFNIMINRNTMPAYRASISTAKGVMQRIFHISINFLIGGLIVFYGERFSLVICALIMLFASGIIYRFYQKQCTLLEDSK